MIRSIDVSGLALQRGERILFRNLSFSLRAGEAAALTGANGAGKTTLLRALAGLVPSLEGRIDFAGEAGALDAAEARQKAIHMIGHFDGLKSSRTAWEELRFQAAWTGGTEAAAREAAARLDLTRLLQLDVRRLSAGQRRRLALARLLASPRSLWLLDEPMAPLDARHREAFGALMGEHLAAGGLILAAVHDPLPLPTLSVAL